MKTAPVSNPPGFGAALTSSVFVQFLRQTLREQVLDLCDTHSKRDRSQDNCSPSPSPSHWGEGVRRYSPQREHHFCPTKAARKEDGACQRETSGGGPDVKGAPDQDGSKEEGKVVVPLVGAPIMALQSAGLLLEDGDGSIKDCLDK